MAKSDMPQGMQDQMNKGQARRQREDAMDEALLTYAEALLVELTHIRKGRKAPALMLVFDADHPDRVVGVRLALLDLTPKTTPPAGAAG